MEDVEKVLGFVKELERLKDAERTAWTGNGRRESVAEHTFRLALFAFALAEDFPGIQMDRVILMCLVHDLGEAYAGDISAVVGEDREKKLQRERLAIEKLTVGLPELRSKILSLWEEYNRGESREAMLVKALDKMETILQHNQGKNPPGFDYQFILSYGKGLAGWHPVLKAIRKQIDKETRKNAVNHLA